MRLISLRMSPSPNLDTILIYNSCFSKVIALKYCKIRKIIWKFTITMLSCIKLSSRCFCNPVLGL